MLVCLLTAGLPAAAAEHSSTQPYVWRSWTRLDGLPGSQVWTITQDQSGYIWIGTNEGLVRFDGVRFVSGRQLGLERLPNASVRALLGGARRERVDRLRHWKHRPFEELASADLHDRRRPAAGCRGGHCGGRTGDDLVGHRERSLSLSRPALGARQSAVRGASRRCLCRVRGPGRAVVGGDTCRRVPKRERGAAPVRARGDGRAAVVCGG